MGKIVAKVMRTYTYHLIKQTDQGAVTKYMDENAPHFPFNVKKYQPILTDPEVTNVDYADLLFLDMRENFAREKTRVQTTKPEHKTVRSAVSNLYGTDTPNSEQHRQFKSKARGGKSKGRSRTFCKTTQQQHNNTYNKQNNRLQNVPQTSTRGLPTINAIVNDIIDRHTRPMSRSPVSSGRTTPSSTATATSVDTPKSTTSSIKSTYTTGTDPVPTSNRFIYLDYDNNENISEDERAYYGTRAIDRCDAACGTDGLLIEAEIQTEEDDLMIAGIKAKEKPAKYQSLHGDIEIRDFKQDIPYKLNALDNHECFSQFKNDKLGSDFIFEPLYTYLVRHSCAKYATRDDKIAHYNKLRMRFINEHLNHKDYKFLREPTKQQEILLHHTVQRCADNNELDWIYESTKPPREGSLRSIWRSVRRIPTRITRVFTSTIAESGAVENNVTSTIENIPKYCYWSGSHPTQEDNTNHQLKEHAIWKEGDVQPSKDKSPCEVKHYKRMFNIPGYDDKPVVMNNCKCNEVEALHNRYLKDTGFYQPDKIDWDIIDGLVQVLAGKLLKLSDSKNPAGLLEPNTVEEFISEKSGALKNRYCEAATNLIANGVDKNIGTVDAFIKNEKYSEIKTPRAIMGRNPQFNLLYQRYITKAEKLFMQLPQVAKGKNFIDRGKQFSKILGDWILENDYSKFEGSQRTPVLMRIEYRLLCLLYGQSEDLDNIYQTKLYKKGRFPEGTKFCFKGCRGSGDMDTGFGNTVLNYIATQYFRLKNAKYVTDKDKFVVDGDDSYQQLDKGVTANKLVNTYEYFGFETKLMIRKDPHDVEFCSSKFLEYKPGEYVQALSLKKLLNNIQYLNQTQHEHSADVYYASLGIMYRRIYGDIPIYSHLAEYLMTASGQYSYELIRTVNASYIDHVKDLNGDLKCDQSLTKAGITLCFGISQEEQINLIRFFQNNTLSLPEEYCHRYRAPKNKYKLENIPLSLIDSMGCVKPVIQTQGGPIPIIPEFDMIIEATTTNAPPIVNAEKIDAALKNRSITKRIRHLFKRSQPSSGDGNVEINEVD
ncbi:hypothetical protein [Wenzhou tombus-like virus 15]|uniref:hypothetical protein n=1 Tax=Wenzhou tombus-like virus 15 TaxID=1923668 RepID=UPI00090C8BF7|nr:hypothetical protein [Wenzhou tombus-like virus 15]APG76627.1 hypothetical protein [Wenzhou tombus-like virus 15]